MKISTEPIGSIPRSGSLIDAMGNHAAGNLNAAEMDNLFKEATQTIIRKFEESGSEISYLREKKNRKKRSKHAKPLISGAMKYALLNRSIFRC